MADILILYSTVDGHTRTICERLRAGIEAGGHRVALASLDDDARPDLSAYDKIVVGASIRYGKHRPNLLHFADAHAAVLDGKPNAFFTVNIVARKPLKDRPDTNPYMKKFLRQVRWRPRELEVFAGRLDYPRYRFVDRQIIRFIMLITRGPTDPRAVVEFTDWQRVDAFAARIARM